MEYNFYTEIIYSEIVFNKKKKKFIYRSAQEEEEVCRNDMTEANAAFWRP